MELTVRQKIILSIVVESYIGDGEPVGSKLIAGQFGQAVSSATIRNEMAVLEQLGMLVQPHTSAGRIPTYSAFKIYIDQLLNPQPVSDDKRKFIDSMLAGQDFEPTKIIEQVAATLAQLTGGIGLVAAPKGRDLLISNIDFVFVAPGSWAVVLVTSQGTIKTAVCRVNMSEVDAEQLKTLLHKQFVGMHLFDITPQTIQSFVTGLGRYTGISLPVLSTLVKLIRKLLGSELVLHGQENLLLDERNGAQAERIIKLVADKNLLQQMLPQTGDSVSVHFGDATQKAEFEGTSMVVGGYTLKDGSRGTLGIIGPMRMNYADAIGYVQYFTMRLNQLLEMPDRLALDEKQNNK